MAKDTKDKEFNEPDETTTPPAAQQPIPDQDMLTSEPVIDRSHAGTTTTGETVREFTPPPYTGDPDIAGGEEEPKDPADNPYANPGVKDAPPHVKKKGAEFVADKILKGWGKGKTLLGEWLVLISEKKVDDLEEQGLADRNIPIKMRNGKHVPAGMLITAHNHATEKVIRENALTPEFYDEAMPMIVEELSKRDIALTNMQMLAATAGMDLYNFGEKLKPLWEQRYDLISAFKETTAAYRQAGGYQANFNPGAVGTGPIASPQPSSSSPDPAQPTANPELDTHEQMPAEHVAQPFDREDAVANAFDTIQSGGGDIIAPHAEFNLPGEFVPKPQMPGTTVAGKKRPYTKGGSKKKKRGGVKKHKLFGS